MARVGNRLAVLAFALGIVLAVVAIAYAIGYIAGRALT